MTFEEFILAHESDDTAALLLARHRYPGIDLDLAVTTIQARRRLRRKLPSWYANPALVYPSRLSAEQCSSEETARYKALVASNFECLSDSGGRCWFQTRATLGNVRGRGPSESWAETTSFPMGGAEAKRRRFETNSLPPQRRHIRIVDLTGGMGVDSWAFSQVFDEVLYNEMQTGLAEETARNFERLGCKNISVRNEEVKVGQVKEILGDFVPDVIYLDPARRAEDGRKVFLLEDCQPNVTALLPELFEACPNILLKLSPMADISYLARELPGLAAVHIVGADGECKELLLLLQKGHSGPYALVVYDNGAVLATRLQPEGPARPFFRKRAAENGDFAPNSPRVCSESPFCSTPDANAQSSAPATAATEGCRFRGTPLSSFASAPPIVSCVPFVNLSPTGPSPCPSPGVDTSPETTPSSAAAAGALLCAFASGVASTAPLS